MAEVEVRINEPQTCPRRVEGPNAEVENEDRWVTRSDPQYPGLLNTGLASCSYCGSMHPEDFLKKVREGWVVSPTDKSYKAYLEPPATLEDIAIAWERFKDSHIARLIAETEGEEAVGKQWDQHERHHVHGKGPGGKFYFQHLSAAQRREFIELYNDKTMVLGYPGYFYTRPFFVSPA